MLSERPANHYTIGIDDDLTHRSIPYGPELDIIPSDTVSCKFWGLGGDGTVGANKNSIKIIGDHTAMNVQAYFEYDGKKSGGVTRSHLRFGSSPIRASYLWSRRPTSWHATTRPTSAGTTWCAISRTAEAFCWPPTGGVTRLKVVCLME